MERPEVFAVTPPRALNVGHANDLADVVQDQLQSSPVVRRGTNARGKLYEKYADGSFTYYNDDDTLCGEAADGSVFKLRAGNDGYIKKTDGKAVFSDGVHLAQQ